MTRHIFVPVLLSTALAFVGCNTTAGHDTHDHMHAAAAPVDAAGAIDLHNTICPVTGDEIHDPSNIAVYQGKIYHFCCGNCPEEFKKDPAPFAKLIADNPAKYGVK